MIDMLLFYNIKPIFIFDGKNVSAKNKTLQKRKKVKDQNKEKAEISIKNNDTEQGKKYLSRCITIDEKAIALTMNLLISKGVDFVVAPY
jgi:flap endonuclease-1